MPCCRNMPRTTRTRRSTAWLVYLDISLPHRGSTNLIEVLDEAARKIQTERLVMPEVSVTGTPALPHQWQQGFLRLDAG